MSDPFEDLLGLTPAAAAPAAGKKVKKKKKIGAPAQAAAAAAPAGTQGDFMFDEPSDGLFHNTPVASSGPSSFAVPSPSAVAAAPAASVSSSPALISFGNDSASKPKRTKSDKDAKAKRPKAPAAPAAAEVSLSIHDPSSDLFDPFPAGDGAGGVEIEMSSPVGGASHKAKKTKAGFVNLEDADAVDGTPLPMDADEEAPAPRVAGGKGKAVRGGPRGARAVAHLAIDPDRTAAPVDVPGDSKTGCLSGRRLWLLLLAAGILLAVLLIALRSQTLASATADDADHSVFDAKQLCALGSWGTPGSCVECSAGKYGSKAGASSEEKGCTDCALGTFGERAGLPSALNCSSCPAGQKGLTAGQSDQASGCEECVSGSYCPERSAAIEAARCPMGFFCATPAEKAPCPVGRFGAAEGLTSDTGCTKCAAGMYGPTTGASICLDCTAGDYCPAEGASSQTPCPRGKFCLDGAAVAEDCPVGRYGIEKRLTSEDGCVACPPNTYGEEAGQTSEATACKPCTSTSTSTACPPVCPPGKYCEGGDITQPVDCPSGRWSATAGLAAATYCTVCPAGKFGAAAGKTSEAKGCSECKLGSYGTEEGLTESSACSSCPAGTKGRAPGKTTQEDGCKSCDTPGRFCPAGTATDESLCPLGRFSAVAGLASETNCTACSKGKYGSTAGMTNETAACSDCPLGKFGASAALPSVASCTSCPAGRIGAKAGQSTSTSGCTGCPAGYVCAGEMSKRLCGLGFYCAGNNAVEKECSLGSYCSPGTKTKNPPCNLGSFCVDPKTKHFCPIGRFGAATGLIAATDCTACSAGKFGFTHSGGATKESDACNDCSPGGYCPAGAQLLIDQRCPMGYFCPTTTTSEPCPVSTWSDRTGLNASDQCTNCTHRIVDGRVGQVTEAAGCLSCPQGSYCPTGNSDSPTPCPLGRWGASAGLAAITDCALCPAGKFGSAVGKTTEVDGCSECPLGFFGSQEGLNQSSACSPCAAGTKGLAPGKTTQADGCTSCDTLGRFCPPGTATDGLPCPLGSFGAAINLASPANCTQCSLGKFGSMAGMTNETAACSDCPLGTFGALPGLSSVSLCTNCPAGRSGDKTGASSSSSCAVCPAGFYCLGGTGMKDCETGDYCPEGTSEAAPPCPLGFYCPSSDQKAECPAGTYGSDVGLTAATQCSDCVTGKYSEAASSTCKDCDEGKHSASGSAECVPD